MTGNDNGGSWSSLSRDDDGDGCSVSSIGLRPQGDDWGYGDSPTDVSGMFGNNTWVVDQHCSPSMPR